MDTVKEGAQVALEYTLKLDDRTTVESNVGKDPITYQHGAGQMLPGLEKQLNGMKVGESKDVTLPPEEGYGPVNPEAVQEVAREQIPENAQQIGAQLQAQTSEGQMIRGELTELRDDTAVVDFNHPLAGRTLHFSIKVVEVKAA